MCRKTPCNAKQMKKWGKHTISGFYLGNSWGHYCCHEILTIDTRSVRVGQTVFFKHKYLTDPVLMESNALLQSLAELWEGVKGLSSDIKAETKSAIEMLINIFKSVANNSVSGNDNKQAVMAKAAKTKTDT